MFILVYKCIICRVRAELALREWVCLCVCDCEIVCRSLKLKSGKVCCLTQLSPNLALLLYSPLSTLCLLWECREKGKVCTALRGAKTNIIYYINIYGQYFGLYIYRFDSTNKLIYWTQIAAVPSETYKLLLAFLTGIH